MVSKNMKESIWQDILRADHGGKLSGYLTAFDQSIIRFQVDPCSEQALNIYSELIKKYREGSLQENRAQSLNMFSFGKQNPFGNMKVVEVMAKRLNYDEEQTLDHTKRIKSTSVKREKTTTIKQSTDILERQLRRTLNQKRTKEFLRILCLNRKERKIKFYLKKRSFTSFRQLVKKEAPQVLAKRLKRFKLQNAKFFEQNSLKKRYFYDLLSKTIENKTRRAEMLKIVTKQKNLKTLYMYFEAWIDYATRREDQKLRDEEISGTKNLLRKKIFLMRLNSHRFRKFNNEYDNKMTETLQRILFFKRLIDLKDYQHLIKEKSNSLKLLRQLNYFRFLSMQVKRQKLKLQLQSEALKSMTSFLKKSRFLKALSENFQAENKFWSGNGKRKIRFLSLFLNTLEWKNKRLGYEYKWMKDLPILNDHPKVKAIMQRNLMRKTFTQFVERLIFEKRNIIQIKSKIKITTVLKMRQTYQRSLEVKQIKQKFCDLQSILLKLRKNQAIFRMYKNCKTQILQSKLSKQKLFNFKCIFIERLLSQRMCKKYVNQQFQRHTEQKNTALLMKCFTAAKKYLCEKIYSNKIVNVSKMRRSLSLSKKIFAFIKVRTFQKKLIKVKQQNLITLRRMEYGEKFIKLLKQWSVTHHHTEGIKTQATKLYCINLLGKGFNFWKIYAEYKVQEKLIQSRVSTQYLIRLMAKCFELLKLRRDQKIEQKSLKSELIQKVDQRRKKQLLNLIIQKTIQSVKLKILVHNLQKLIKLKVFGKIVA